MNYYPDILMHSDVWQGFGDDATAPKDQNHTPFNFYNGELEASTWDPIPFCFDECSRMTLGDLSHFYLDAAVEGRVLIAQQQVQSSQEPKQTEAHLTTTNATETQRFSSEFPSTTPPDSAVSQVQRDLERSHRKVPYVRKHRRRHPDCEPSKKSFHNDIEKQYRSNLNQKIAVLRDTVPSLRIVSKSKRGEATAEDYERLDGLQPAYKVNKPMVCIDLPIITL